MCIEKGGDMKVLFVFTTFPQLAITETVCFVPHSQNAFAFVQKKSRLFIFPHPLTVDLFFVVEKMPHLILSCEVQGSFRLKCSSYKEELGTPVFLTVNEIKTHRGRCYSAKYPLDINCMAKYFTFGESLAFFVCFLQFLPGKTSSKITKEFLHSFSNFLQQLLHSSQTVFVVERRHVANHDTTPHCI